MIESTSNESNIGSQAVSDFHSHLAKLWEKEAEFRLAFNDPIANDSSSNQVVVQLMRLEDWYECLLIMQTRIYGFLSKEELVKIDELFAVINKKTNGLNFILLAVTWEEIIEMRDTLRIISRELFIAMSKHDMLLPRFSKNTPKATW